MLNTNNKNKLHNNLTKLKKVESIPIAVETSIFFDIVENDNEICYDEN